MLRYENFFISIRPNFWLQIFEKLVQILEVREVMHDIFLVVPVDYFLKKE